MIEIPLARAIEILRNAAALEIESHAVVYGTIDADDPEGFFFRATWEDDLQDFGMDLEVKYNETVRVEGCTLVFQEMNCDDELQESSLRPLYPRNLEDHIKSYDPHA